MTKAAEKPKASASWKRFARVSTQVYTLLILTVFILWFDETKYLQITRAKYRFFLWASCLYLGLLLLRYVSALIGKEIDRPRLKDLWTHSSVTQKALALFLLLALLSAATSPYQETVWKGGVRRNGMFVLLLYGFSFLAVSCFGAFDRRLVWALAAAAFLFSTLGILQCFGLDVLTLYPPGETYASLLFVSTAGNIDFACALLCVFVPLLSTAWIVSQGNGRYWLPPAICSSFFFLLLIDVDAGKVALAGTLFLMLPVLLDKTEFLHSGAFLFSLLCAAAVAVHLIRRRSSAACAVMAGCALLLFLFGKSGVRVAANENTRKKICTAIQILLALAALAGALLASSVNADNMLYELGEILRGRALDYMGHGRIGIWRRSLQMAMQNPLLGTGPDTFASTFSSSFGTFVAETSGSAQYDAAHNEYLQYLCLYGIPGCLAYLTFLGSLLVRAFRRARSDGWTGALLAGVLGYAIEAFFGISIVIAAPVFFITAGLLEGRQHDREQKKRLPGKTLQNEMIL